MLLIGSEKLKALRDNSIIVKGNEKKGKVGKVKRMRLMLRNTKEKMSQDDILFAEK